MSRGHKVVWDDSNWRFEGWAVPAKSGENQTVAIAFHGFDRNSEEMENFMPLYDDNTALLSINLLHHGESRPLDPLPIDSQLDPEFLLKALDSKARELFGSRKKTELLGYSMGSRIAFKLLCLNPTSFSRIIVLAPDGMRKGLLYRFVVHTWLGRWCWSLVDKFPRTNRKIIDTLYKVKLISGHKHHFGRYHTDSPRIRKRVSYGWAGHKRFWPNLKELSVALSKTNSHIILGKKDKIIPAKWALGLKTELNRIKCESVNFHIVNSGHVMRHAEIVEEIASKISASSGKV